MKKYHHITVFFTDGSTARFHDAVVNGVGLSGLSGVSLGIEYVSASDGMKNVATIFLDRIAIVTYAEYPA